MIRKGFVPVFEDSPEVEEEKRRQAFLGMPPCDCSVCDPEAAKVLLQNFRWMTNNNFDDLVTSSAEPVQVGPSHGDGSGHGTGVNEVELSPIPCPSNDPIRLNLPMIDLAARIEYKFEKMFNSYYKSPIDFSPSDLISRDEVWAVVKNYDLIERGLKLSKILGGEPLEGTYTLIIKSIFDWKSSESYSTHLVSLRKIEEESQRLEDLRLENIRSKEERAKNVEIQKKARQDLKRLNAQIREEKTRQREQRAILSQTKRVSKVSTSDAKRLKLGGAHKPRSSIIKGMIEELIDPGLLHRSVINEPVQGSSRMEGVIEGAIDPGLQI